MSAQANVPASIPALHWAAQRPDLHDDKLTARFGKWSLWLSGEAQPTLRQLEKFVRLTHTAIGYFFLPEAPVLALPMLDFRRLGVGKIAIFYEAARDLGVTG